MAIVVAAIDYRHYERHGWVAYGIGVSLLIYCSRWAAAWRGRYAAVDRCVLAAAPELMKIFLIIALAKYLHNDPKTTGRTLRDLIPPGMIPSMPMISSSSSPTSARR